MNKPIMPPSGSPEARFLKMLLTHTMSQHPEYLQKPGHLKIAAQANILRELGWPLKSRLADAPRSPYEVVLVYYLNDEGNAVQPGDLDD